MISGNTIDRKSKIAELLLKDEIKNTIILLKPFYNDAIIENFDDKSDFIFYINNIVFEDEIKTFLNNEINYKNNIEDLIIILEKSFFIDNFLDTTANLINLLCQKILNDFKQKN